LKAGAPTRVGDFMRIVVSSDGGALRLS